MSAQTFQFRRHPAERARLLTAGPHWGRRSFVALAGGLTLVGAGVSFWSFQPRDVALSLVIAGLLLLVVAGLAACVWAWRTVSHPRGRPWGRLLLLAMVVCGVLNRTIVAQHHYALLPILNAVQWTLAIGLLLRLSSLVLRRTGHHQEAARWAAGATGEGIVVDALAQLEADHVVIHNLPLRGRGDADHVVIGPAGVVVLETKYLAGRIVCRRDGTWLQLKRDEVREISDPAAQVQRAAEAVAAWFASYGLRNIPVRAVLVMAHPRAELDVSRSAVPVLRPAELAPSGAGQR